MSHFIHFAARMQDAGVCSLWVSLGSDAKGVRLMHVSPDITNPEPLRARFPTRTFHLDGTDPVLEQIEDDLSYGEGGVTPGRTAAAIKEFPQYRDDLNERLASFMLAEDGMAEIMQDDAPLTPQEEAEAEATGKRMTQYVKGLIRGMDAVRARDASKTGGAA